MISFFNVLDQGILSAVSTASSSFLLDELKLPRPALAPYLLPVGKRNGTKENLTLALPKDSSAIH